MSYKVDPLPDSHADLGEGPHWDVETQSLYYVDIYDGSIHRYDYKENKVYHCKVANEPQVSFIIPVEGTSDRFALGIGKRIGVVQWDGRSNTCKVERILCEVDTEPELKDNRFNDGKADPRGRVFAGTMRLELLGDIFEHRNGSLYSYVKGENVKKLQSKIGISNGLTWNPATKSMYYIDSTVFTVVKYHYDIETGDISNPKVVIDFKGKGDRPKFVPDGMTIDKNGLLYVATFGASTIFVVNPDTGKIETEIKFPCEQITSAAFGGPNLDILYVTTASMGDKPAPAGTTFKVTGLNAVGIPMTKAKV